MLFCHAGFFRARASIRIGMAFAVVIVGAAFGTMSHGGVELEDGLMAA